MTPAETSDVVAWWNQFMPVMLEHINGAQIQFYDNSLSDWVDINKFGPLWKVDCEYRVKPQPTIRPYTDAELKEQVGKVFVHVDGYRYFCDACVDSDVNMACYGFLGGAELLRLFKHLDGSPCGVTE